MTRPAGNPAALSREQPSSGCDGESRVKWDTRATPCGSRRKESERACPAYFFAGTSTIVVDLIVSSFGKLLSR